MERGRRRKVLVLMKADMETKVLKSVQLTRESWEELEEVDELTHISAVCRWRPEEDVKTEEEK